MVYSYILLYILKSDMDHKKNSLLFKIGVVCVGVCTYIYIYYVSGQQSLCNKGFIKIDWRGASG